MDCTIEDGIRLIAELKHSNIAHMIYGFKIGSLWLFESGKEIINTVEDVKHPDHKIILDMQGWGDTTPFVVKKQIELLSVVPIDEAIVYPVGSGKEYLKHFVKTCIENNITPVCTLEHPHYHAREYLTPIIIDMILRDAAKMGVTSFVISSTRKFFEGLRSGFQCLLEDKPVLYAAGFEYDGKFGPMIGIGVCRFIIGKEIYESDNPILAVREIYEEIENES